MSRTPPPQLSQQFPGPGGSETSPQNQNVKKYKLEADQELRFEVEGKNEIFVTLTEGLAEIFGTEMIKGKQYTFGVGVKLAIFTYHGCTIQIKGKTEFVYDSSETPMLMYLNAHGAIETLRRAADSGEKRGPIVMVVGPGDVGKTTLCRILLNYAVRLGRRPIYVDLDVGQGSISIPGTVGAMLIEKPASLEENGFIQKAPLSYFFGAKTPSANVPLYHLVCKKLADVIHERMASNRKAKSSGVIINTCGWIKGDGYKSLTTIAQDFEADVVIVLDQERLYNELTRDMPPMVKVVYLPKSAGVVERPPSFRQETRDLKIKEYFYGKPSIQAYHPHSFQVKLTDIKIYKIGAPAVPQSCLPIGMKADDTRTKLVLVQPTPANLLHRMIALSYAEDIDNEKEVLETNVAGYICISDIDTEKGRITVLSPQPGPLPKAIFLLSEIQFMDNA